MWSYPQKTAGFVTFTEEILNGKVHFLEQRNSKVSKMKLFAKKGKG